MVIVVNKGRKQNTDNKSPFNNIMKKIKHHWFITIMLVSVAIMLIVHILFKIKIPIECMVAEWSGGDLLLYCGSVIGAVATIYVLQETIKTTINQQREERAYLENKQKEDKAFSIRPYFLITAKEFKPEDGDIVEIPDSLIAKEWTGDINILISIENVGAGNAVDVCAIVSQTDNIEKIVPMPALIVGRTQTLVIRCCLPQKLQFKLKYSDIANIESYIAKTNINVIRGGSSVGIRSEEVTIEKLDIVN